MGEGHDHNAGKSLAGDCDINGDGFDDIIIGAPCETFSSYNVTYSNQNCPGYVYIIYGPVSGSIDLSLSWVVKLTGVDNYDDAGASIACAGDVNNDGFDDVLVGAPNAFVSMDVGSPGVVYLIHGPVEGDMNLEDVDVIFTGSHSGDNVGVSVSGAGDVNNDGFDDMLIGAPASEYATDRPGISYLMYGPVEGIIELADADAILLGEHTADQAGISVSGGGDVNGDGFNDILIGASGLDSNFENTGIVYLVLGPVNGTINLSQSVAKFLGDGGIDSFAGRSASIVGDVITQSIKYFNLL
jgi:hypothetical protein